MKEKTENKIRWHHLISKLLEELLVPVGISVFTDFSVMSEAPEADILLLRKEKSEWTEEQKKRLPDGVRDTDAVHILIEFKYSESVNEKAFRQILCYDYLYREIRNLGERDVASFLLSSKTPRHATLAEFGYHAEPFPGVYRSENRVLRNILLLSLNELSDEPHNAYVKCFASRKKEKESAAGIIRRKEIYSAVSDQVHWVLEGLWHYWLALGGDEMKAELTPESVMKMGKMLEEAILAAMSPEVLLEKYGKQKIMKALSTEERMEGISPEDRLAGLSPEDVMAKFRPEDLLTGMRPEDRLAGMRPEERLAGLSPEEIEALLRKVRNG